MARLIDADELLRRYDETHEGPPGNARKLIEEAPTVGGWVSVKDRMPEKNGRYLCRYEQEVYGEVCRCTDFGMFDSDIGEKGGWLVGKVTHWMPLPAKPKEVEHECN